MHRAWGLRPMHKIRRLAACARRTSPHDAGERDAGDAIYIPAALQLYLHLSNRCCSAQPRGTATGYVRLYRLLRMPPAACAGWRLM